MPLGRLPQRVQNHENYRALLFSTHVLGPMGCGWCSFVSLYFILVNAACLVIPDSWYGYLGIFEIFSITAYMRLTLYSCLKI